MTRILLHNRNFNLADTFCVSICVYLLSMVGVTQCFFDDVIDQAEGSTGEVDISSWTSWSLWSKCSETCGGGLSNRTRYCATLTDSESEVEENICSGRSNEVRVCNRQPCISGSRRQSYCRPLMDRFFHGKRYYWEAFTDPRRPCKAMCHARVGNYYVPTGDTVPDGTLCHETEKNDVCISGRCHKVGCDGIVGSTAKVDLCGVCNGADTSCRVVRSNFTVDASLMKYGYNRIMTVPKGSFNINITELESSRNYLAMKTKSGYSILNSDWRLSHYGHKYVLGTVMDYQRRTNVSCPAQCVFIVGPTNDDIHVQLLFYRASSHFTYQFSTPLDMNGDHSTPLGVNGDHNHMYDITGEPSTKTHHHRHNHPSSEDQHSQRQRQRHRQHGQTQDRQRSRTQSRPGPTRHDSKKRRFQYNESFMAPHHSAPHHQSDSEPTKASPQRTEALRNTRKSRVSPTNHNLQRNTSPPIDHSGRRHRDGRLSNGNVNPFRPSATSIYHRSHRIPNRRISAQWSHSSLEENQPARQGSRDVVGAPSPTIVIANSRLSGDRIRERQQPIRVGNGHRRQQPDQSTSQLSLGTNTVRSSGQRHYLHTGGAQLPDVLHNSKSGSSIAGENTGYSWRISGFTECSQSCGGGTEETIVVCVKDNSQVVVTDENCEQSRKPEPKSVTCNQTPCHAEWFAGPWSECSTTCGAGTQTRQVTCQQRVSSALNVTVSAEACRGQVRNQTNRTCSLQPCFFWKVANWSECSSTCGKGMRVRTVTCMTIEGHPVDERKCHEMRPGREEFCDMGSCATGWFFTDWPEQCPSACGEGNMKRNLHCAADDNTTLPDERCNKFPRPRLEKKCKADVPCGGKWFLGPWSKCNATCGEGSKNRDVVCIKQLSGAVLMVVEDNNCGIEEKPEATVLCQQEPCPPQWYMMNWSKCSKSCDLGHRTREVKCLDNTRRSSLSCDVRLKPSIRQSCNVQNCGMTTVPPVSGCSDLLRQCNLVVRARLCNYHYYNRICCASCSVANEHGGHHGGVVNNGTSLATTTSTLTAAGSSTSPGSTTQFPSRTEIAMASSVFSQTVTNAEESSITTPNADSTDSQS